ncbi:MAG: hypothetical protein ACKVI4_02985 [Actinomycetales bacterium]
MGALAKIKSPLATTSTQREALTEQLGRTTDRLIRGTEKALPTANY